MYSLMGELVKVCFRYMINGDSIILEQFFPFAIFSKLFQCCFVESFNQRKVEHVFPNIVTVSSFK